VGSAVSGGYPGWMRELVAIARGNGRGVGPRSPAGLPRGERRCGERRCSERLRRARGGAALSLAVVALLAGCGSTTSSDESRAGLQAAGNDVVANLEAGRYKRACEDFTATARGRLAVFPTAGCSGVLAFAHGILAVEGQTRLGQVAKQQIDKMLPHATIEGGEARVGNSVEAVYEGGRWRFEASRGAVEKERSTLRADVEKAAAQLKRDGAGALLKEAEGAK